MRSIICAFMLACCSAQAFTDSIWTNIPSIYTNALGMEFVNEVGLRSLWAGSNWYYINDGVTNVFGSIFQTDTSTGIVYFTATEADKITRQLQQVLPSYVLAYYSDTTNDYCFDGWFTNGLTDWPGRDYPKEELFDKVGDILGTLTESDGTNTNLSIHRNIYGEVTEWGLFDGGSNLLTTLIPQAWWIKRRDRVNPLVVGQWKVGQSNEFYSGWPNEYSLSNSTLYGITSNQYPVFVVIPDDSAAYSPNSITIKQGASNIVSQSLAEWTSTNIVSYSNPSAGWGGATYSLASKTQQCQRAFVDVGLSAMASGATNLNGYIVALQYTNKMTTYEGARIWDTTLFPEQLTAHYVAMTNMFLTTCDNWTWTNSESIAYQQTPIGDSISEYAEDYGNTYTATNYKSPDELVSFWTNNCPVFPDVVVPNQLPETNGNPYAVSVEPFMYINFDFSINFSAVYETSTTYLEQVPCGTLYTNETLWSYSAQMTKDYGVSIGGEGIASSIAVLGLYTGTLHRAHVYADFSASYYDDTATMRRLFMTDWTYDPVIITPQINLANYLNGSGSSSLSIPCTDTGLVGNQLCSQCEWVITTNENVSCTNITDYCGIVYDYTTNTNYQVLTNPCDSNATFSITNILISGATQYTNESVTNIVIAPWLSASNPCTGAYTSTWDGVSYSNLLIVVSSNNYPYRTSVTYNIWQDQFCEDYRTNTTTNIFEEAECVAIFSSRVPNTTVITVSNYVSHSTSYDDPRVGDHWGWLEVGPYDAQSIKFPIAGNGDEWWSDIDFNGLTINVNGEPGPPDLFCTMLYCDIHDKWHIRTGSSTGTILDPYETLGLGVYLHTFGRNQSDVSYGFPPMNLPAIPDYAYGSTALQTITSQLSGSKVSTNSVSVKVLIEWQVD